MEASNMTETAEVTSAGLVAALARHFNALANEWTDDEREIAIWICRHWTTDSNRAIARAVGCSDKTVSVAEGRAQERMAKGRVPFASDSPDAYFRRRAHAAEDYLAAEAFALPVEDD